MSVQAPYIGSPNSILGMLGCDLNIPREKRLNYLQTVEFLDTSQISWKRSGGRVLPTSDHEVPGFESR